jgi:hypothetical protein
MQTTVTFSAARERGSRGHAFIAQITGRHPKFTFAYEFRGKKDRNGDVEYQTDEPGLYVERDVDSKGRSTDTFWVAYNAPDGSFRAASIAKERAMEIARRMDSGAPVDLTAIGNSLRVAGLRRKLAAYPDHEDAPTWLATLAEIDPQPEADEPEAGAVTVAEVG